MKYYKFKNINFSKLIKISDTPHSISLGFAIGVFSAFTPLIGLHIVIAIFFSWLVNANYLSSVAGTFIGTPITYPFMWISSILVGNIFFSVDNLNKDLFENFSFYSWDFFLLIKPFLWSFVIGSTVLGLISSFLSYFLLKKLVILYRKRKLKVKKVIK
ncbi:MAG: DUF2062 domain-containing protein [Pseudomonadota bacterium]|nr:DUF2062 domain-containing protein [Pseudomonadota bacterium]MEC7830185.1 DUF2062 domain-containing protein [Pseudomonadota bacterium]MEC9382702.1 DUF2062 domain-containing protein [Pseudomonadota bacterium]|tara:strand:- start:936 stop:1409 length:474 start_codon:yes stop_codon:yes gene_type:complete